MPFVGQPYHKNNSSFINSTFTIKFIENLLPKVVHHQNHLQQFRNVYLPLLSLFDSICINDDFSENLSLLIKYNPQSLHWAQKQVSAHSGVLKMKGGKGYHPHFSSVKVHDQVFVNKVLKKMIGCTQQLNNVEAIIIESDNCSNQGKSAQHFYHLQEP